MVEANRRGLIDFGKWVPYFRAIVVCQRVLRLDALRSGRTVRIDSHSACGRAREIVTGARSETHVFALCRLPTAFGFVSIAERDPALEVRKREHGLAVASLARLARGRNHPTAQARKTALRLWQTCEGRCVAQGSATGVNCAPAVIS